MERRAFLTYGLGSLVLPLLPSACSGRLVADGIAKAPLYVRLPAQVRKNASLIAEVLATGTGYLASDFRAATTQITLSPSGGQLAKVDLGPVRGPGLFSVFITAGGDEYEAQLFVIPKTDPNTFDISALEAAVKPLPVGKVSVIQGGFRVLAAEFSPERLAAAAKAAGFDAATTNLPNTIATGTVLLIGFAVIVGPVAAATGTGAAVAVIATPVVTSTGAEFLLDFGLSMYEKYVEQLRLDGKLTQAVARDLVSVGAGAGVLLSLTRLRIEKGLAAKAAQALRAAGYIEKAVPQSTNPQAAQVLYGTGSALTSKSVGLIRLLKL